MVSVGEVIEQVVEKLGIGDKLCEQQALTRLPDVVESVLGNRTDVCPVGFRREQCAAASAYVRARTNSSDAQ